jgi:hypothetical protein
LKRFYRFLRKQKKYIRQDQRGFQDHLPRPEAGANTVSALRRGIQHLSKSTSDGPKNFPWGRRKLVARGDGCLPDCLRQAVKTSGQSCESCLKPKKRIYLKATDKEVGLLLNFGPKPEIKRKIFDNFRK